MRISRLTIDKLGIQMYDRVSAVLAELIANAYDADAENVTVTLPVGRYLARKEGGRIIDEGFSIIIEDDGSGMTAEQVNEYYLNVGYNRRHTRGEQTPVHGRRVMGRKGIGKLAPFGICREVEIVSAGGVPTLSGYVVANLILDLDKILQEDPDGEPYHPDLGELDGTYKNSAGTKLILKRFDHRRVPNIEELDRQLSARFGLPQGKWRVRLSDNIRNSLPVDLGTLRIDTMPGTRIDVDNRPVTVNGHAYPVSGWVAYAKDPYKDEVMAGVRLYSRGKFVAQTRDFDIKSGFTGEFKMRSYLTGEIHADWLDDVDDLIRTDRQDIIWNSELGSALQGWGQELLKQLARSSETSSRDRVWNVFLEHSNLHEQLAKSELKDSVVRDSVVRAARALVGQADRDSVTNTMFIERVINLAYAIGPHRSLLETLDEISSSSEIPADAVLGLFEKASVVEMYSLGQVAKERVESIAQLTRLISDPTTVEMQLQRLIENAPWLLYPDWTPLSSNNSLSRVRTTFESWYKSHYNVEISTSTIGNATTRPDFILLNHRGQIEIVEIKRPRYAITDEEFVRAFDYLIDIEKFIFESTAIRNEFSANLTIVCDSLESLRANHISHMQSQSNITHRTWHTLLESTKKTHEDFISVVQRMQGRIPPYSKALDD